MIEPAVLGPLAAAHVVQCTVFFALAALLASILRRAPARLVHLLWLAVLIKLFLPLPWLAPWLLHALDARGFGTSAALVPFDGLFEIGAGQVDVGRAAGVVGVDGWLWAAILWLCGALVLVVRELLPRPNRVPVWPLASAHVPQTTRLSISRAMAGTGIAAEHIAVEPGLAVPAVVGLWRPRIVLPALLAEQLEEVELRAVLLHEDAHRRRHDPLVGLLQRLAVPSFYFWPPLWLLLVRLRASAEMACDEAVLACGVPPDTYARALARTVHLCVDRTPSAVAAGDRSGPLLRQRFLRIAAHERYRTMLRHRLALSAVLLAFSALTFAPIGPLAGSAGASDRAAARDLTKLAGTERIVWSDLRELSLRQTLEEIAAVAGVRLVLDPSVGDGKPGLDLSGSTVREALEGIGRKHRLSYRVDATGRLVVSGPQLAGAEGTTLPVLLNRVQPEYPKEARELRRSGKVILQVLIDETGAVRDTTVLRVESPGFGFEDAAIEAVEQWHYQPATREGLPVAMYFTIVVGFTIE